MHGVIAGIEYFLPEHTLSTGDLAVLYPSWSVQSIDAKTGIHTRHIAADDECASDLAQRAAAKLFESRVCAPRDVDFILLCTQSPDYALPTTACLLQTRLDIPTSAGALDYNLGCSGFVYGLGLAEGLIASGQAKNVLLLTADTYSKYLEENDKTSRTIFGDAAAATFITSQPDLSFGPFQYGTDGKGACNLIVPGSGTRKSHPDDMKMSISGLAASNKQSLYMNGNNVFQFAIDRVPNAISALLDKAGLTLSQIDRFIFHQANAYLLDAIRSILNIPPEKVQLAISHCGNTISSTIPIALKHAAADGCIMKGDTIMLVGFGVGYSWAATIVQWAGMS